MKALLVNAPPLCQPELGRAWTSTHLHLLYSVLRAQGVEVEVFDPIVDLGMPGPDRADYLRRIASALARYRPEVAGVSCWTSYQYLGAVEAGRLLREAFPDAVLCVGGWHAIARPQDFLEEGTPFDLVVRGPGERVLPSLCREPRRPPKPIAVDGEPMPLDEIRLDWSYPYRVGTLYLSRGCPNRCQYCVEGTIPTPCTPEHAAEEYARAAEHSRDGFVHVSDACFAWDKTWRRAFLRRLPALGVSARLEAELRVDLLEPEDLELLGAARALLYFGLDSGSPHTLRLMRKTTDPERYLARCRESLAGCDRFGVDYRLAFLYNHPGETPASLQESIDFYWRLVWDGPSERLQDILSHCFGYYPGTAISARREELARLHGTKIGNPEWWRTPAEDHRALAEENQASTELPLAQAREMAKRMDVANWFIASRRAAARQAAPLQPAWR